MGPNDSQLSLLRSAIAHLDERDYSRYLELRQLLAVRPRGFEAKFRRIFQHYFALNSSGLTEAFKDIYFERLFAFEVGGCSDPYTPLLRELYSYPRRQGDRSLQASFVSKLVAIHDENRPIFDRHVGAFFGLSVPSCGGIDFRIAGFVENLRRLEQSYHSWSEDSRFRVVLADLCASHPRLAACSSVRLADILVWTVGRRDLGRDSREVSSAAVP